MEVTRLAGAAGSAGRLPQAEHFLHHRVVVRAQDAPILARGEDLLGRADALVGQRRVGRRRLDAFGQVLRRLQQDVAHADDRLVGRAQVLLAAVPDRPGRLRGHEVLADEVLDAGVELRLLGLAVGLLGVFRRVFAHALAVEEGAGPAALADRAGAGALRVAEHGVGVAGGLARPGEGAVAEERVVHGVQVLRGEVPAVAAVVGDGGEEAVPSPPVRISAYCTPYPTVIAPIPFGVGNGLFVPIDDYSCYRWNFASQNLNTMDNPLFRNGSLAGPSQPASYPYALFGNPQRTGPGAIRERGRPGAFLNGQRVREYTPENDYKIDRESQKSKLYTGIENFVSQDLMATESAGPIWDRSQEHLGTTDKAIIRMRNILLKAAKDLAKGIEPPATDPSLPYKSIRSAEKVLAPGEDWRVLGTDDDPMVQEVLGLREAPRAAGGTS